MARLAESLNWGWVARGDGQSNFGGDMKSLVMLAMCAVIALIVMMAVTAATGSEGIGFIVGGVAAFWLGIAVAKDGLC